MKAIQTRIIPASNNKPTRIKAMAEGVPSITLSKGAVEGHLIDGNLPHHEEAVHQHAAKQLALKYGWTTEMCSGGLPNGDWAHCFKD